MNLKQISQKFRRIADEIDDLLQSSVDHLSPEKEHAVRKELRRKKTPHWTQLPENKAKLRRVIRGLQKKRKARENAKATSN